MRIVLDSSESKPQPTPARTDDRKAILVGTAVWIVVLVACLVGRDWLIATRHVWYLWMCVAGLGLGIVGLVYSSIRRR